MATFELTSLAPRPEPPPRRYVHPPQPIHFPESEEMPETNRHMELRTALYQILKHELAARATVGSDQFVYYNPRSAKQKLAPDAFFKLGMPHNTFRVWKTWERGAPDVAVEVVSDSDEGDEAWEDKLERYASAGIAEVVRFDPDDSERPIRVWDHVGWDLVERMPPEDGVFECASLHLFWVAVAHPAFVRMLRLSRDREGHDLLPTPAEAEGRARIAAERARAEQESARIAAERARAEQESARIAAERAREVEAQLRVEAERARAEQERAREVEAQLRVEAERARDALAAEMAELRKRLEERTHDEPSPKKKAGSRPGTAKPRG